MRQAFFVQFARKKRIFTKEMYEKNKLKQERVAAKRQPSLHYISINRYNFYMTIREQLNSIAEKRILILDGAMGSMIQTYNLNENDFRGSDFSAHPSPLYGCNDLLCLTKPETIESIHTAYLEAGADIIETCSFNATSISLSGYGLGDFAYKISAAAAKIARNAIEKFSASGKNLDARPRFTAGSIGPTAKGASLYPDVNNPGKRSINWDELESAYYDSARGLLDGGIDIFLVETVFDTLNAKAALFAINRLLEERQIDVPVIISAAVSSESGRLLSGQSLEAFCVSVLHAKPWAVGLNCSFSADKLLPLVRQIAKTVPCRVSVYPNAGLPNKSGSYDETPEKMSANVEEYFKEELVNIIGGCCGTSPAYIAEIAKKAAEYKPRKTENISHNGRFSGLEILELAHNAVKIREIEKTAYINDFLQYIKNGEYEDAVDTARDFVDDGGTVINIKIDDENSMSKFLDFALMNPYAAKIPFFLNSSQISVLQTGLKRLQGRGFAGHLSLKDGDEKLFREAEIIRRYGAAAVFSLIDEHGQAETFERKTEIMRRIYCLLQKSGYPAENIVFDLFEDGEKEPLYLWIRENCPGAIISI